MSRAAPLACAFALLVAMATAAASRKQDSVEAFFADRDQRLVAAGLAAMPRQQAGVVDLYAIGVAGDGSQDVFRNEARYFATLMAQRFHARGVLTLVSHPDSLATRPAPLASYDNLYDAITGVARRMDRREDILLLYLTMHGTADHQLALYFPPLVDDVLVPEDLAYVLDKAGIRNRVIAISACYSGGFIRRLQGDNTLLMTAARSDRPSFGCDSDSNATYFGRAWLVEGLNRGTDFPAAFRHAEERIAGWEASKDLEPSHPQISEGKAIRDRLAGWNSHLAAGAPVPYPWPLAEPAGRTEPDPR
ncbi:MAG TPA: C13 family peptidase [Thermomonas sp.]|nr:C13 family peptidase [Thermomonas sp.]